jgi:hypothetical protein
VSDKWHGGKGDRNRTKDIERFNENFERIFGTKKRLKKFEKNFSETVSKPENNVKEKTFNDLAEGRLPNDILFLAEQNEENRAIVEDIRRLNKILLEELTKQNIQLPEGE